MSKSPTRRERRERKERKQKQWETALAVLLVVLPEATHVPLVPGGLILYCAAWVLFMHLLFTLKLFDEWTGGQRFVSAVILTIIVAEITQPSFTRQWHKEMSEQMEGVLYVRHGTATAGLLQFGTSGTLFSWDTADQSLIPLDLLRDAQLRVIPGKDGQALLSTVVRDRYDHEIVKVDKNHWEIQKQYSVDHNYTDDSLEVLDSGGHIVLQLHLLPDKIQIRGEWHDAYGGGVQVLECADPDHPSQTVGCESSFGPAYPERDKKVFLPPMFKYPSSEHWGEFVDSTKPLSRP